MENYLALDENNNNIMPAIQSFPTKPAAAELTDEATHHSNNHSHLNHLNHHNQHQLQHGQQIQQQQIQIKFEQQVGVCIVAGSASNSSNSSSSSCSGSRSNGASRTSSTSSSSSSDGTSHLTDIDTGASVIKLSPLAGVVSQTTTVSSLACEFGANSHQLSANGTIAPAALVVGGPHLQSNNHNGSIITLNANGQPAKPRGRRKKIRTEPIRPICPQCDKQFSNQSALTKHKLTHSDERKFTCQQCSKAFKRQDHLTGHMQTHSNRKPFNCTIQGCDKTYCDARSLRRHKENIHHIVTPKENGGDSNHHQHQHNSQHQLSASVKVEQQHNNNNHNHHHHHHHHHNHLHQQPQINGQEQQQQQIGSFASNGASGDQIQSPNGIGGSLQTLHHHHHQQQPDHQNHNGVASQHQIQTSHHQQQQQQQQQLHQHQHQFNANQHQQSQQQPASAGVQQIQHTVSSTTLDSVGNCLQPISNRQTLAATSNTPTATPTATRWTSMENQNHQYQNHQPNQNHHPQMHHPHSGGHQPHHGGLHNHNHLGGHYNHHHQAPYSADYATSQHFSFDFSHPQPHMTSPMDQLVSSNSSIPHSADSVAAADSSQLVGAQHQPPGGYLTPTTLHPPTPNSICSSNSTTASAAANSSNSNNNVAIGSLVSSTQFNAEQQQQPTYKQPIVPSPSFVANSSNQQPSHLLRRRIQRLHSDGATYGGNALDDQLGRLEPIRQQPLMQIDQQQHYQQASYSADYASTQHFSFEFNHMTHMDQPLLNGSSNTIPHSADSITDSGLGLNVQYEQQLTPSNHHNTNANNTANTTSTNTTVTNQHHHSQQHQSGGYLTPTTLLPPTPNTGLIGSPQFNNNTVAANGEPTSIYHQQQQTQTTTTIVPPPSFAVNSTNQQPSHLLRRRTQRLHSDSGSYTDDQSGRSDLIRQQPLDPNQAQQQHYQPASYSADYASTQHFSFDSHEDHNNQVVIQQQTHLLGNCIE